MSNVLEDLKYTKEHEWLKPDEDFFLVGITDHAQDSLGDIVFIEFTQAGNQVKQGDVAATIESVKAVSEIYTPISGEIIEVNQALNGSPDLVNREPYEKGWLFKIKNADNSEETSELLSAEDYKNLLESA